jgi:hypothetical protein
MTVHDANLKRRAAKERPRNGHRTVLRSSSISESLTCANRRERDMAGADSPYLPERSTMLITKKRCGAVFTLRGWAIAVLTEAGAIRECEHHGWMQDRGDPHARARALLMASEDPPPGLAADEARAAIEDVLGEVGDTCPECPPE